MSAEIAANPTRKSRPFSSVEARDGQSLLVQWTAAVNNYNGKQFVLDTIASLKQQTTPPSEILLVDDGSSDGSVAAVRAQHPDVRIVVLEHVGSPTPARNYALRIARQRYVLLSDNDVMFRAEAFDRLAEVMLQNADAAVCTPRVVYRDDPETVYSQGGGLHYLCWSTMLSATAVSARAEPYRGIGGGIQLIDREKAEPLGFFDENLAFGWGEDADLHHRLHLAGWSCYVVPQAVVLHARIRQELRVYGQIHNRWAVILKTYRGRTLLLTAPALAAYEFALIAYCVLSRKLQDYWRAMCDVGRKLALIRQQRRALQALRRVPDRGLLCADDLALPRQFANHRWLGWLVGLLNRCFRVYWRIVFPVL